MTPERRRSPLLALACAAILQIGLAPAHAQGIGDPRGHAGQYFSPNSISTWRASAARSRAAVANAPIRCEGAESVSLGRIIERLDRIGELSPDSGGDYDNRSDKMFVYRVGAKVQKGEDFIFGCWAKIRDIGNFDKAQGVWIIPKNSSLTRCELSPGRRALCY